MQREPFGSNMTLYTNTGRASMQISRRTRSRRSYELFFSFLNSPVSSIRSISSHSFQMKTNFKEQSNISPFYTGGNVCLDGKVLYSPIDAQVAVLDWATGQPLLCSPLQVDSDQITSLALSPNSTSLVVATRSLLLCVYEENVQIRSFKAHEARVLAMQWDPSSTLLATGSADSSVKVWDMKGNYCTHYLKGHGGIITSIAFHPTSGNMMLYSAAEDGVIKVWDLVSKNCVATLSGHVSPVKVWVLLH
jgi:U3 small nucleolar RNA-associated protein 13